MTVDKVELQLAAIHAALTAHTSQDMGQFTSISDKLNELDAKLDALLIREARREGETAGLKKSATTMAAVISFLISVGVVLGQTFIS